MSDQQILTFCWRSLIFFFSQKYEVCKYLVSSTWALIRLQREPTAEAWNNEHHFSVWGLWILIISRGRCGDLLAYWLRRDIIGNTIMNGRPLSCVTVACVCLSATSLTIDDIMVVNCFTDLTVCFSVETTMIHLPFPLPPPLPHTYISRSMCLSYCLWCVCSLIWLDSSSAAREPSWFPVWPAADWWGCYIVTF